MAIENLKKHLILPLLVLISFFGYIRTKERASKQKAGAILSGSQNKIFILLYSWLPTLNHGKLKKRRRNILLNFGGIMAIENL